MNLSTHQGRSRRVGRNQRSSSRAVSSCDGPRNSCLERNSSTRGRGRSRGEQRGRGGPPQTSRGKAGAASHGFTLDLKYEWNKLYVLGLRKRTTKDALKNYIERISDYDVRHVLMFSNGKAIVTLNTTKITDFEKILEGARNRKCEDVDLLIERAPVCKSILVRGIPDDTPQETVEKYFDEFGVVERIVSNIREVEKSKVKDHRAILYFKSERSVKNIVEKDHFLGDNVLLHVERYYPYMGTVEPVDSKSLRYTTNELPLSEQPYFHMDVDVDVIEFIISKCNQGLELKDRLFRKHALINLTKRDGFVFIKHSSKPDEEFDEDDWENCCRSIVTDFLNRFNVQHIPVDKDIWEPVVNQLPKFDVLFPSYSAQVTKCEDLKELKLICLKTDLPSFEKKVQTKLTEIKQEELDKTLEQKTLTDISNEKLQLLKNAKIEKILKQDVHEGLQIDIDLSKRSFFVKAPEGQMGPATAYLRNRIEEIDQNSLPSSPQVIEILKTRIGKRKLNNELKEVAEGCSFNVDEKSNLVLFLGTTPSDTHKGSQRAKAVLITGKIHLKERDNELVQSEKWSELCRDCEKGLTIRCERRLTELHVFGLKKDVEEALIRMREFLNARKAEEGEFRFESPIHRRLFHTYYREEITKLEEDLSTDSVKITFNEHGDLFFIGTDEGVNEVKEKLNALQDEIQEQSENISLPGMRSFLAKNKGELVGTVEKDHKCVIEIEEISDQEDDSDDTSSLSTDSEKHDEDDATFVTPEGKKIIWKPGDIAEEEADVLVCSVGSNLNLSIGAIARAVSLKAGPELQSALHKQTSNLRPGEEVHTSVTGNLSCRHVVFCVCCPWDKGQGNAKTVLQTLLWNCFEKASVLGSCSVALPLIGTGNLFFPRDVAVQVMVEQALNHSESFPNSPIEEFRFIVHADDRDGISTFQEKLEELKEKRPPPRIPKNRQAMHRTQKKTPIFPGCKRVLIGESTVELVRGDITKESSDGVISTLGEDLQMRNGKLSAVIVNASGTVVQEELNERFPQAAGSVVTTSAGNMAANYIIHMVVSSVNRRHLRACIEAALEAAHSMNLQSVSIPAACCGGLGLSPQESAEVVLGAIKSFLETARLSNTVRQVRISLDDESVEDAFSCFLKQLATVPEISGLPEENEGEEASGVKMMAKCYQHRVMVYGRHEVLEKALTALKTGVTQECDSIDIKDDAIHRLPKRCVRQLRRKGREEDVSVDLSQPGTITLQGFPADVLRVNKDVLAVISDHLKKEATMELAEMISRNVQWCYLTVTGKHEPFEKMANYEIETAAQAQQCSVSFTHRKLNAEIVFELDQVTFVKTGAVKKIFRKEVIPPPPEWDPQPLDINRKPERVHLVRLEVDSSAYQDVQKRFKQTTNEKKVCLTSIQRVQNPSMYRSYAMKKQSMDERNGNHKNERYLFHGTSHKNVKDITAHGFNRSFCGSNGASYGDGVYFATEASYSEAFSKTPGPKGEYCMFLAKVLVGKFTRGQKGIKTPPPIDPNKRELLYDSVVDTTEDPTLFAVFHDDQCYPEYLITFKRSSDQ